MPYSVTRGATAPDGAASIASRKGSRIGALNCSWVFCIAGMWNRLLETCCGVDRHAKGTPIAG